MKIITYDEANKMSFLKLLELAKRNVAIVSEFQEELPPKFTYTLFHIVAPREIVFHVSEKTGWEIIENNFFIVADIEKNVIEILENLEIQ
ncbi:MAG: hypothetical protein UR69_C0004G0065 [Candidatus Moranbacteria bacterium GW2011_GWE2_35_2-]|nr:MAG: hypothetical protein UR69_C0004G0065 [Candidatus Moranbacteria bacterium GW2011_GWE2_35_2-]KKQ05601.1 MAG: hypothetical protein US15_C0027G0005 [Candidatus Moranbacteria bacterium GW2011_GWF1_36_4]KKQ22239.1 MAG: hypothetical protein US37_C0003G0065 [Candidatus Moranbacteria bacterium GW2011_GWF2_37_11]KKQ28604.1 MAG: hypothetical protein US44_C0009G0031 [Candidatus Moranbacteria bacterium GW2011_GWD1_37_17]KKQ30269.1 MAG: hypothetical protein US47_C0003G0064 [Candidatus Moranbacteria b